MAAGVATSNLIPDHLVTGRQLSGELDAFLVVGSLPDRKEALSLTFLFSLLLSKMHVSSISSAPILQMGLIN